MRKRILIGLVCIAFSGQAQKTGYTIVQNIDQFKKDFAVQHAKLNTIRSSFTQEKTLTLLTEKIVSTGDFWFKRNDKIRIEYKTPYRYVLIIDGDQMITRDDKNESHINTSSSKLFKQVNRIIIDCVQGSILNSKDFSIKVFENKNAFLVQLTPNVKTIKEFFQTITLRLDKNDYSVSELELLEQGGDVTGMRFSNKQLNTPISDAVFTVQ